MEYSNPFDDPQGQFYILENATREYSLWPAHCPIPAGWQMVRPPEAQAQCVAWLADNWQTLAPQAWIARGEHH
ncbi:MbtH family NRPS accessory protein [Shimwellia pseudoproteus]|uniref:MbtH family protein n=1 Tax=Shimwellia pseudoproteus TaxID=570012 RepID=UPI0018ECAEB0|nr:MbtH family NRPS accessory protein [Shimwellia pseudoproteus]MBJ3815407.1 MbtH family NRPS accessory protein [Shimwellia pseudoproteus]